MQEPYNDNLSDLLQRSLDQARRARPTPTEVERLTAQVVAQGHQIKALESAICPQVASRLTRLEKYTEVVREIVNKNYRVQDDLDVELEARIARIERALASMAFELVQETSEHKVNT